MSRRVSQEYLDGILKGRAWLNRYGMGDAQSPVGQMLRGERDFKRGKRAPR